MELEGWDTNPEECEVDFEGKLESALEDLDDSRLKNIKYKCMLEKSKETIDKLKAKEKESKEVRKLKAQIKEENKFKEVEVVISKLKLRLRKAKELKNILITSFKIKLSNAQNFRNKLLLQEKNLKIKRRKLIKV